MASRSDTESSKTPQVIQTFLVQYEKDLDYHTRLAEFVSVTCKDFLRKSTYDANVTYRVKEVESLRKKLCDRYKNDQYKTSEDIRNGVADICGVRIALFFPHHRESVNNFIENAFQVQEKVNHPRMNGKESTAVTEVVSREINGSDTEEKYRNRFSGYQATHYRVQLKPGHARDFRSEDQVEIQVMSVLQSAWSEVEHNIIYKQLKGHPSQPEKSMLDGLNGLVLIGELYLEQISRIYDERMERERHKDEPFANKYELGSFLTSTMRGNSVPEEKFTMSSVELLRRFLKSDSVKLDSKTRLSEKLQGLDTESISKFSLKSQLGVSQKPNVALVVLERLMQDPDINVPAKVRELEPPSQRKKCRILLSTIISLHELFPPVRFWVDELNKHTRNSDNLDWLMDNQAPRNILLDEDEEINTQDSSKVTQLWNWFETHPSPAVGFVFTISKLGVLRDLPQEFDLLNRIYVMRKEYVDV